MPTIDLTDEEFRGVVDAVAAVKQQAETAALYVSAPELSIAAGYWRGLYEKLIKQGSN